MKENISVSPRELFDVILKAMEIGRSEIHHHPMSFLNVPQYRALANIARGCRTPSELATTQNTSRAGISRLLEALVESGLIARAKSLTDRRQLLLSLTVRGATVLKEIDSHIEKAYAKRLKQLSQQEQISLVEGLSVLRRLVREKPSAFGARDGRREDRPARP